MIGYQRAGEVGLYLTRESDGRCGRIDPCGYQCEAGMGGHDGPHLFEEHLHRGVGLAVNVRALIQPLIDREDIYPDEEDNGYWNSRIPGDSLATVLGEIYAEVAP